MNEVKILKSQIVTANATDDEKNLMLKSLEALELSIQKMKECDDDLAEKADNANKACKEAKRVLEVSKKAFQKTIEDLKAEIKELKSKEVKNDKPKTAD